MGSKIKIEDVRKDIEAQGWQLISDSYKNLQTDLELKCPNEHQIFLPYSKIRNCSIECPICAKQSFIKVNEQPTKKKGFRILALDQATHISGWSVFEQDKLVNYGTYEAKSNADDAARISEIKAWLSHMCTSWKVDLVCFEDIQLQKFKAESGGESAAVVTYKKLAHLQGVLINYCYENNIPYEIMPVATWRNFSNVKGKTRQDRKKSAQLRVLDLFDVNANQDISDAILIGRCAAVQKVKQNTIIMF